MNYLFDSKTEIPALAPVELTGPAALHCFRMLLAAWLAEDWELAS